jgi:hypothetical protein
MTTQKELDAVLSLVNGSRKYPEIGYYYAMSAYGGSKLVQIINDGGGVRDVLPHLGYIKRPALISALRSFLAGRSEAAEEARREIREQREARASQYAGEVQA